MAVQRWMRRVCLNHWENSAAQNRVMCLRPITYVTTWIGGLHASTSSFSEQRCWSYHVSFAIQKICWQMHIFWSVISAASRSWISRLGKSMVGSWCEDAGVSTKRSLKSKTRAQITIMQYHIRKSAMWQKRRQSRFKQPHHSQATSHSRAQEATTEYCSRLGVARAVWRWHLGAPLVW